MPQRITAFVAPCLLVCAALSAVAQEGGRGGGQPPALLPENPQSLAHTGAAKKLADGDPMLMGVWSFFCTPTDTGRPQQDLEGVKVFDNLYAVSSSPFQQTTVWAITTSDGIIMIDSGEKGRTEKVLAGFRKLGLDPARVKYILLGHGHGDHYAGAGYFQEHFGTHVGTTAADWDLMFPPDKPLESNDDRPRRDLVLKEGQPVTLGGETVTVVEIPGHTPGSVGFIFKVTDNGQPHMAAMFGGTILGTGRIPTEGLRQYTRSIDHFLETAKKMGVDVEIQNHAMFDDTPGRLARVQSRKSGEPNPFVMSIDKYSNMWNIVSECIQGTIARRPDGK